MFRDLHVLRPVCFATCMFRDICTSRPTSGADDLSNPYQPVNEADMALSFMSTPISAFLGHVPRASNARQRLSDRQNIPPDSYRLLVLVAILTTFQLAIEVDMTLSLS